MLMLMASKKQRKRKSAAVSALETPARLRRAALIILG
jgi:hypothetical protein